MRKIALAIATVILAPSIAFAGTATSLRWKDTTISMKECLVGVKEAIISAGFTTSVRVDGFAVYGEQGEYISSAHCLPAKSAAIFMVTGPDKEKSSDYNARVYKRFEKE